MEEILKLCLQVNGMTSYYPIYDEYSEEPIESRADMAMKFGYNNGVLAFVTENGDYFITPFTHEVAEVLKELGYTNNGLYVPFSNGEIPSDKAVAEEWEKLCEEANRQYKERKKREKRETYQKIAEERELLDIAEEAYQLSINIPEEGIETSWFGQESEKTPPIFGWEIPDKIGTYYSNNGILSFVDAEGRMFITPFAEEVTQMLEEAGYKRGELYVPLSNGEVFIDPLLADKWEIMCEEARRVSKERKERQKKELYKKIAEEKELLDIPETVYQISIALPDEIETSWFGHKSEKMQPVFDWEVPEKIGTYCQNNGIISFVDASGRMFISPFFEEVANTLERAGYTSGDLYVPLSNSEEFVDPELQERWRELWVDAHKKSNQR